MDKAHIFRRIFHLCAPLFLVYYLFPEDMWGLGISSSIFVVIILVIVLAFEGIRLATGRVFFGLRKYEKGRLSAYAWAGIAITLAFLFFPPVFVICAIVGMGWTDPLIGELRLRWKGAYPSLPLTVYFLIVMCCLLLYSEINIIAAGFLACLASYSAVHVEAKKFKQVDDDFLMLIVPLLVLTIVYEVMTFTGIA